MELTKFIESECIVAELPSSSKGEILKELTHKLFDTRKVEGVGPALDQILAREGTESTGIGNGIAVPHARVSGLKTLMCAVGRNKKGIDFAAVDKQPVHMVFLICYPPTQQTTYLNFVATIAKLLRDEESMRQLLAASDAADIHKTLEGIAAPYAEPEQHYQALQGDNEIGQTRDAHADLMLLARLQLCNEMLATAKSGKKQIKDRIDSIRALIDPRILRQFDKLSRSRAPALVPVEGDTCQGCFMRLPSQFVQKVRQDHDNVHMCTNCSRLIYIV